MRAPRTIPFAYREKLKDELDLLAGQGVIAPVTEPTEWCAPIVVNPQEEFRENSIVCGSLSPQSLRAEGTVSVGYSGSGGSRHHC